MAVPKDSNVLSFEALIERWRCWDYKQHRDEHRAGTRDMMYDQGIEAGYGLAADELEAALAASGTEVCGCPKHSRIPGLATQTTCTARYRVADENPITRISR